MQQDMLQYRSNGSILSRTKSESALLLENNYETNQTFNASIQ